MARSQGIKVHVYGDYDNKQIDKAIRDLKTLRENGEGMGSAMAVQSAKVQAFGASMAAVGMKLTKSVTLPIVGVATAAIIAGADFERSMNKVKAISGATGADFEALKQQAKDLGRTTGFSASQAADAMSFLAMAGFKTNDILGAMPGTLNLAAAGNLDLARAADIASNILTGYNMEVSQLDHAVDVLAKTFTSANTDLEQLGEAFKYAGPVASSAGVKFEQAAAAIGLMGNAGIQGSMAGTSLRGALAKLLNPTTAVQKTLEKLGVTTLDSTGNLLPLDEIVRQLGESGATTGDYMTIFGQRAGPAMAALVTQGADALVDLTTTLENSGGTAEDIANTQLEGFHGALIRLKSAFEAAMIAIAESGLLEKATSLIEGLVNVVANFAQWVDKLPKPLKDMAFVLGAVLAAAGPLIFIFGKFLQLFGFLGVKLAAANAKVMGFVATLKTMGTSATVSSTQVGSGFGAIGASAVASMGIASRAVSGLIGTFKALGAVVKGFLASLGPVGIAIAVLGTAYAVFSGKAAEAEAKVTAFKEALMDTDDAARVKVLQLLTEELSTLTVGFLASSRAATDTLSEIGIGMDEAALAVSGTSAEFETFKKKVKEAGEAAGVKNVNIADLNNGLYNMRLRFLEGKNAAGQAKTANDAAASAAAKLGIDVNKAAGAVDGFADGLDELGDEAADATQEIKKLSDMFSTFDANVSAIRARDAFRKYMREFGDALAKNNRDLLGNNKEAEKNRDAVIGALEKKKAEVLAWAEANGKGQEDVDKKWAAFTSKFAGRLKKDGFKAKDIEEFFGANQLNVASVSVQAQMGTAVTSIKSKLEPHAFKEFKGVGVNIVDGTRKGVLLRGVALLQDVRALVNSATTAAKNEAGIQSPSKVFMEIGRNVVKGFVNGINSGKEDARKAARESMVKAVKQEFDKALSELKSRLETARSYAMGWRNRMIGLLNLGTAFAAAQDKDKAEADALKQLNDVQASLAAARADLASAETEEAKEAAQKRVDAELGVLASAQQAYQNAAAAAAGSWVDEFKSQLTKAANFANLLNQLKQAGAHEMLVQQVAEAGVDAGTQMAHDLINGGAAGTGGLIDQFNTDFKTFDAQVTDLGVEFANSWAFAVGPKMGNLTAARTLKAFRERFGPGGPGRAKLMQIMDNLAASMSRTARVTVVVDEVPGSKININGARADGGKVWPGGTFLVGEKGPELFQPATAGNVIPNRDIRPTRLGGASSVGGSTTINLTVNAGMGTNGAEVGRQVVDAIKAYERRNGAVYVAA